MGHHSRRMFVLGCCLELIATAVAAAEPAPSAFTRPSAVMDRPQGGDAKSPVSWRSLAIAPNGKTVIGAGMLPGKSEHNRSAVVAIWQAESGKLKAEKPVPAAGEMALSADGKVAVVRSDHVRPLPASVVAKARSAGASYGGPQMPLGMSFHFNFLNWPLADDQPTVMRLDIGKPAPGTPLPNDQTSIFGSQFLSGRKFALGTTKGFLIWDYKPTLASGSMRANPVYTLPASKAALDPNQFDRKVKSSLGIAADGSLWVVQLQGGEVEGWDLRKSKPRFKFPSSAAEPVAAVPADGKFFALATSAGAGKPTEVEIRSGTDGEVTSRLIEGPSGTIVSLAVTPDGSVLAAGRDDGTITVWNVAAGAVTDQITGLAEAVWPLAISQKGTVLASADKTGIQVWDLERLRNTGKSATPEERPAAPDVAADSAKPADDGNVLARGPSP